MLARFGKALMVWLFCLCGIVACIATPNKQSVLEKIPEVITLQKKLQHKLALLASDKTRLQQFNRTMQSRTLACQRCHGVDGHSRNRRCPNLAGQSPAYLLQQIQDFSEGRRHDYKMWTMVNKINDDDKIAVAIFFSNFPPRPSAQGETELSIKGEAIFQTLCTHCHGRQGEGQDSSPLFIGPRLAGQLQGYISMTLREFRKTDSRRQKGIMSKVASALSDNDIQALAAYISRMK